MNAPALVQLPNTDDQSSAPGAKVYSISRAKVANQTHRRVLISVLMDVVLICTGGLLALKLEFSLRLSESLAVVGQSFHRMGTLASVNLGFLLLYATLLLLAAHSQNLYRHSPARSPLTGGWLVVRAVAIATVILTAFIYLSGIKTVSRLVVGLTALFSVIALTSWRACRWYVRRRQFARGVGLQHALIVGAGKVGQLLAKHLDQNPALGYNVKGFVDSNHHDDPRILGKIEELSLVIRQEFIDEIFITIPSERELVKTIAQEVKQSNLGLKVVQEMYDGLARLSPEEFVGEFPIRVLQREPVPNSGLRVKRIIDVLAAGIGLVLLSPFFALIALAVKLDSSGPVFYRASRVGKKGRRFICYKFRTMIARADEQKSGLQHLNERTGPLFKIAKDPRVTRLGSFLRKHSIDELPQLWNVVKGDMSLVGPRPPEFDELIEYKLEHLRRLDAIPGITGLWQVSARQDPYFETVVALDNHYIEHWNLMLDFRIMLKTIPVVLKGLGR
jgi:exopolysaccharide biosynthesis polyprenyl glycosylphosphotransferase